MNRTKFSATLMSVVLFAISLGPTWGVGGPDRKAMNQLAATRVAGLQGDHSQLMRLRATIKNPYSSTNKDFLPSADQLALITALRASTRLGDTDAVPDIDHLIADNKLYPDIVNYARVQRARLLAQSDVQSNGSDKTRVQQETLMFCSILGLTPSDINAGIKHYQHQLLTEPQGAGNGTPCPVEVYALREVADMAYQSQSPVAVSLLNTSALDFSQDYPSALKMRLAPLSRQARIAALIASLVSIKILGTNEEYEMQLLADEAQPAGRAIALQLQDVMKHRDQYQDVNISALFRVLTAIGDPAQAPAVAQFLHDPDINVRQDAEMLKDNLPNGTAAIFPRAAGY